MFQGKGWAYVFGFFFVVLLYLSVVATCDGINIEKQHMRETQDAGSYLPIMTQPAAAELWSVPALPLASGLPGFNFLRVLLLFAY